MAIDRGIEPLSHPSPSLLWVAIAHVALFVAGVVAQIAIAGSPFPNPLHGGQDYFAAHPEAPRLAALFLLGSMIPFAAFVAVTTSRLRFLRIEAAGVTIAQVGGIAATGLLAVSGVATYVLAAPEVNSVTSTARAMQLVFFTAGGPVFTMLFGLFIAGVSVSGGLARVLPRWVMWFGLVIAGIAQLSLFTLIWEPASYAIPLGRFGGIVWMFCMAVTLPKTRT